MKNTITRAHIDALMAASQVDVCTKFDKVTIVTCKLPNGFVLVEASGAVSKENYSEEMGRKVCLDRIATKLWSFEGYVLSTDLQRVRTVGAELVSVESRFDPSVLLKDLAVKADALVEQIERCGASPELTNAVVMADDLRRALVCESTPLNTPGDDAINS